MGNDDIRQLNSLDECYAKTRNNSFSENIIEHSILSGLVAKQIIKIIGLNIHPSACFFASIHDIGKISLIFQSKIRKDPEFLNFKNYEKEIGYHSGIGVMFLEQYFGSKNKSYLAIARHHGYSSYNKIKTYKSIIKTEETNNFHELRERFIKQMISFFNYDEIYNFKDFDNTLLSGLITLSDWISSGLLFDLSNQIYNSNIDEIIYERLIKIFGKPEIKNGLSFSDIYNLYTPTQTQISFYNNINKPGVYFVEEQAGNGKSEIAFYAAYQIMQHNDNIRGIYFALPTQLTSNNMYDRAKEFVKKISPNNDVGLFHGNSDLYLLYNNIMKEETFIDNKNLELFKSFSVGTIDQLLLSVLNSKFNFLKTFSLYNKIIIIDEIHSYDYYMIKLIKELIKNAQQLGCYVIALSATLPNTIKDIFVNSETYNDKYPLLTYFNNKIVKEIEICANLNNTKKYFVDIIHDDEVAIHKIISDAQSGLQTLWIENSVAKSQYIFSRINEIIKKQNLNIETGLLHSNFLKKDKYKIEKYWVSKYGKNSCDRNKNGRILVSTQVVEQSIDIDADVLYTRIAPIDMLIQRIGRCWRHNFNKRNVSVANVHILSDSCNNIKSKKIENWFLDYNSLEYSGFIYPKYYLYKTLEYFEKHNEIFLPFQLREMINYVYNTPNEETFPKLYDCYNNNKHDVEEKIGNASYCIAVPMYTRDDIPASTRLIDDTINILIVKKIESNNIIFVDNNSTKKDDYYKNRYLIDENTITVRKNTIKNIRLNKNDFLEKNYGISYCLFLNDDGYLYSDQNECFFKTDKKYDDFYGFL